MTQRVVPVIMAGGKGTRLWPLSRANAPKQFIRVINEKTLFQKALERVSEDEFYDAPVVITNEDFRFAAAEQAREINAELASILLEPVARNTAAAIAAAALHVQQKFGDSTIMHLLASDHEIDLGESWKTALCTARDTAADAKIVTFGILPTEPATGYGYIEAGEALPSGAHAIKRFVEKPDAETAKALLADSRYLWNSGMFMARVDVLLQEFSALAPEVYASAQAAVQKATFDLDFTRLDKESFKKSPNISVDYAIMEKTSNAAVVFSTFAWSDLGSWDAVWKGASKDDTGNVVIGNATVSNTKNSLILSRSSHLAIHGLENVAVIASEDATYVGKLDDAQSVADIVKRLASNQATSSLTEVHPTSYRPWGGYTSLLQGDRFQVKRLFVLPGKKLSLQKHFHRSEHWVCVKGTAEVTLGDKTVVIRENESVYIPQGELHRLFNPGMITLEVIEVQTGSYLGEDDIVRVSDEFGRG